MAQPNDNPAQVGEYAARRDNLRSEFKERISDLGSRLYYCSNSGEGRKMRRWIEKEIKRLEAEIEILDQFEAS